MQRSKEFLHVQKEREEMFIRSACWNYQMVTKSQILNCPLDLIRSFGIALVTYMFSILRTKVSYIVEFTVIEDS